MQKDAKYKRRLLLAIIGMLLFVFISFGTLGVYIYKTFMPIYRENQTKKANAVEFKNYIKLVTKYDKEKKYDEELYAAKKALSVADGDIAKSQAYYAIGNSYFYLEDYDKAEENAKKSIKLDPNYSYAYDTLFLVSMNKKEYDSALSFAKKFIKIMPKSDIGYASAAYAYYNLGNKDEAVKNITKAIEINPKEELYKDYLKTYQEKNETKTNSITAADINPEDKDPNYWKTQLGYMNDDEKNINTITGNPKYDQAKLTQARNMLNQRKGIINPIYAKLQAGQALNNPDAQALDRYWAITEQYYILADEILHPK